MSGTRWYLVLTQLHTEQRAVDHLRRQGFETYLPRYMKRRRHARRIETVAAPLFPRYLFVAVDMMAQRWLSIRSTIGVSALVCNGDVPAAVPDAIVQGLRNREVSGFVVLEQRPQFMAGERIRIADGVFANCLGLFEGLRDQQRVAVLLDLLGRKTRRRGRRFIGGRGLIADYVKGGWSLMTRLLKDGKGTVVDVKSRLDRDLKPEGIELWRL